MIPQPLYRALPYLYLIGGVCSFYILPSPFRYISGGLLVLAGAMVLGMRHQHRPNDAAHKPRPSGRVPPGKKK
jgi:hypothetical protein